MFKINVTLNDAADSNNIGKIFVTADVLDSFEVMEGFVEESHGVCSFLLNRENCLLLREFLPGKSFHIDNRSKALLRYVADEDLNDSDFLTTYLTGFIGMKPNGKFGRIKTMWDLIHYLPHRYIDRSHPQTIDSFEVGEWAVIVGTIVNDVKYDYAKNYVKIVIQDVNRKRISSTFFRQKWLPAKFKKDDEVVLYGNYSEYVNKSGGRFPQISNAEIDKIGTTKGNMPVIPIYPQKDGDKSWRIQQAVKKVLTKTAWIEDPVPEAILKKYGLISRNEAYRKIHFPDSMADVVEAKRRIAFDDFVRLQVFLLGKKEKVKATPSAPKTGYGFVGKMVESLPYGLTSAQSKVMVQIKEDLESASPMVRLLQGDVGSGKTMVAFSAVLHTVGSGQQCVVVAPTDILTNQLYNNFLSMLDAAGLSSVNAAILTGKTTPKNRGLLFDRVEVGEVDVLFSTHAVLFETLNFTNLGLIVIDEQHKFGVEQRDKLITVNKEGFMPDVLTMSATPIPRTSAQILYGDMDISVIDELPAGRKPIVTQWVVDKSEAWVAAKEQIELGRQVYVVAALVEESETLESVEDAETVYAEAVEFFAPYSVKLVHGRMKGKDKAEAMGGFVSGETDVLISTSVIEVGVDIPNASIMVILNANRFGIASLHQIRGRVGRGSEQSYCFLVGEATTLEAQERLTAMVESNDGFYLAEKDLEIRGEGKLFGLNQSGGNELFIANLREHKDILDVAKRVAKGASSSEMLMEEVEAVFNRES